ncbi:chemotaxis protein CheV [Thiomicrospira microaerophila]|uniref:chemotaxis protein CheV n=1 Tax=Thiomicrospira microaerophila TaxID=406020 RepID=UPI00200EDE26|nr:chemotaxis protein CheV [Thiomicrospira microaerophila]UQB43148.1 chemotaxis protein CheV [Thiomicrospira microaerophila]
MDLNTIDKTANLSKNNAMSLMVFKLVSEHDTQFGAHPYYAMNIFKIKEVLNASEYAITRTTINSADFYKGVIAVRGEYINVYDTAKWFGHAALNPDDRSVILICEVNHQIIGLLVAYIHGVTEKDWKELQSADENAQKIVSQTRVEDELCLIMDVEQMIAEISGTDLEKESKVESLGQQYEKIILFADDQASIRGYVKAVLENLNIKHEIYNDGSGIINFLEQPENRAKVGLIITDLEMPNVSGHTVIRTIKEKMGLTIPIIVHSSMTVGDSVRQAKQLGADGFIGKIDTAQIVETIKKYFKS